MANLRFEPHKYQKEFLQSNAKYRFLCAGRRGGKTVVGAIECVIKAASIPNGQGAVLSPTYPMLRDVVLPELLKWSQPYIKDFNKTEMVIVYKNGFKLLLRSADNPDRLRGLKLHFLWMDEASYMTQLAWETIAPALTDYNGIVWVTTTPRGKDWVFSEFYVPFKDGDKDYHAIVYKTIDNPHINKDFALKQKDKMRPEFYRQEYEASFEEFIGQIYSCFRVKTHVIAPFEIPHHWRRVKGMDIGFTHPYTAVWLAISPQNKYYVYQEYKRSGETLADNAKSVKAIDDCPGMYFAIDPSAYAVDHATGTPKSKEVEQFVTIRPANNDVLTGINRVFQLLKDQQLFIFDTCSGLIDEMLSYKWDEDRKFTNGEPKPVKVNDDVVDSLRYAIMEYWEKKSEHHEPNNADWLASIVENQFENTARRALELDERQEVTYDPLAGL